MRRLLIGLLAGASLLALLASGGASAQDDKAVGPVDVLQVSGLFDHIIVDEIGDAIERSDEQGAQALVLQVNSRGATVGDDVMAELLQEIADAPLPIGVWVGPAGAARLYGTPAQILAVADVTGMAPGARVGFTGPPLELADATIDFGIATDSLRNGSLGLSDARSLDVFKQRVSDEGIATFGFDALTRNDAITVAPSPLRV